MIDALIFCIAYFDANYFTLLQGFQNLVGLFLEFKYLQGQKKTLQEIVTILLIFK